MNVGDVGDVEDITARVPPCRRSGGRGVCDGHRSVRADRHRLHARRCHRGGRAPVPSQQRRVRRQAAARDDGIRLRVHRLRRRRLAGHPARQRHGLARPQAAAIDAAPVPQQPQRHVHRRHARGRPRRRAVRHGRRRRRLQQRRLSGHPDHVRRPEPAVPQHRQGHVRRRRRGRAGLGGRTGVQHVGAVVRLRPRRPARSLRLQLRASGRPSATSSAASTASRSRTARPKRTAATRAGCSTTAATARSKTSPRRAASSTRARSRSAWR